MCAPAIGFRTEETETELAPEEGHVPLCSEPCATSDADPGVWDHHALMHAYKGIFDSCETITTPHMLQDLLPCLNGELRSHQLEGVKWLGTNYFSGLNGILSDELLHDRQVQVVGLIALLKSKCVGGPFLIVASPGSLSGWAADLHRLLPQGLLVHNYSSAADSRNMLGLICSGQGAWCDHRELYPRPLAWIYCMGA